MRKKLLNTKLWLITMMLMLFSSSVWSAELTKTFTFTTTNTYSLATTNTKDGKDQTITDSPITIVIKDGSYKPIFNAKDGLRFYNSAKMTISVASGYELTEVSFTGTDNISSIKADGSSATWSSQKWTGGASSVELTNGSTQSKIKVLTIKYQATATTYDITKSATNGTISTKVGGSEVTSAAEDATVTITATPSDGYAFGSWSVTKTSGGASVSVTSATTNPTTFTMPGEAVTVSATFNPLYAITLASSGSVTGGSFSANVSSAIAGATVTLTATPSTGYSFSSWTVTDEDKGTVTVTSSTSATTTFTMPAKAVTVSASFTKKSYDLTLTNTNGSLAVTVDGEDWDGSSKIPYNAEVEITATPNDGYAFVNWTSTNLGEFDDTTNPLTFNMPVGDVEIIATFESASAHSISITDGVAKVNDKEVTEAVKNTTVTIVADSKSGYRFKEWTVTSGGVTIASSMSSTTTFVMGTANVVISANYDVLYTIATTSNDGTHCTITAPESAIEEEVVKIKCTPADGYRFKGWSQTAGVDGIFDDADEASTTFLMPASNVTLKATIEEIPVYTIEYYVSGTKYTTTRREGTTLSLESPSAVNGMNFAGWSSSDNPANPSWVANTTTISEDLTESAGKELYAMFTETPAVNEYRLVESAPTDWSGQYLITYQSGTTIYVADGSESGTTGIGSSSTKQSLSTDNANYDSENKKIAGTYGDNYYVTLESVTGGYVLKTQDDYYNYQSNNNNGINGTSKNKTTAGDYPISITFDGTNKVVDLQITSNSVRFVYCSGSGTSWFRYYKTTTGLTVYQPQLYKKYTESAVYSLAEVSSHDITIDDDATCDITAPTTANTYEEVEISYDLADGYRFGEWVVEDENGDPVSVTPDPSNETVATFIMPDADVTVSATYNALYTVSKGSESKATWTNSVSEAIAGETVMLTCTAVDDHYELTGWTVLDGSSETVSVTVDPSNNAKATFTMPASNVTTKPIITAIPRYNVNYYVSGSKVDALTQEYERDEELELPSQGKVKGMTFKGWSTSNSLANINYAKNGTAVTSEMNLYAVFVESEVDGNPVYQKVTSEPDSWAGDYLIVSVGVDANSNNFSVAFDGSLSKLDANQDTINVTITDYTIPANNKNNSSKFTIAAITGGYSIKSAHGDYIYSSGNTNNLSTESTATNVNKIQYNNGNVDISTGSSTHMLQYNKANGTNRFRFYSSDGQTPIQLYKLVTPLIENLTFDVSQSLTVSASEWATMYYTDQALVVPENVVAITYTLDGTSLKRSITYEEGDVIPAGEPVVVHAEEGSYNFYAVSSETTPDENNLLRGTTTDNETTTGPDDEDYLFYKLSYNSSGENVGFYWGAANGAAFQISKAHRAYLCVPAEADIRYFVFGDDEEVTGILGVEKEISNNMIYDLQGRRVLQPQKGQLYIVNGKKVLY